MEKPKTVEIEAVRVKTFGRANVPPVDVMIDGKWLRVLGADDGLDVDEIDAKGIKSHAREVL